MANILFLCTGNSCRSQMAEGWCRHLSDRHEVQSAGIEAHGLNPRAVSVMAEESVDISGQLSKTLDAISLDGIDLVVTVCGDADERCPVLPSGVRKVHWPLADPARITGTESQILDGFRRTRDQIHSLVTELLITLS